MEGPTRHRSSRRAGVLAAPAAPGGTSRGQCGSREGRAEAVVWSSHVLALRSGGVASASWHLHWPSQAAPPEPRVPEARPGPGPRRGPVRFRGAGLATLTGVQAGQKTGLWAQMVKL